MSLTATLTSPFPAVTWTPDLVKAALAQAFADLKRQIARKRGKAPRSLTSCASAWEKASQSGGVLGWLAWLTAVERQIVAARALGFSWRALEDVIGRSQRALQDDHARALDAITARQRAIGSIDRATVLTLAAIAQDEKAPANARVAAAVAILDLCEEEHDGAPVRLHA